jgi:hypothetical protein
MCKYFCLAFLLFFGNFQNSSFKVSIRQCRRAVVDLDKIMLVKHKLTLRDFKPKTGFNIELVVGVQEFGKITYRTPYVTPSFDAFVFRAIRRFTYEKFEFEKKIKQK